ncbi:MAG: hypothetical protein DRP01_04230 [Archaeoglobales archaeon]|nr:MAG: hypothetical protein DRP01_04230 [Archaeoglobales archaeon]
MVDNPLTSAARERLRRLGAGIDQSIESADFANIDLPLSPFTTRLLTSSRVVQSIARLYGWQSAAKQWRALKIDAEGRLHVTPSKVTQSTATIAQVVVTDSASKIIEANSDRVKLKIKNVGAEDCYIGTSSAVTTTSGWLLEPGDEFEVEYYTGAFYALTATGYTRIAYYEV